ncbi:hypothetical protein M758_6G183100 [Ceratodon purpureus]|nr:hypothetical protein M758_6G183100 [Ceratodon purpureus]
MEEPASSTSKAEGSTSRANSPPAARLPPKIQVKSQNPISNPQDPRAFRAPSPVPSGDYAPRAPSPAPCGNYAPARSPSPAPSGNYAPARSPSPAPCGNYAPARSPSPGPSGNYAPRAPSPAPTGNQSTPINLPRASPKAAQPPAATRSPSSPERLRGGSPDVKAKDYLAANPHKFLKQPPTPRRPKSPVRSPKTPSFVPPDVITPVFPAEPADMAGAMTSMDTGLTYPWNMWGPITKYGYLDDVAPTWAQKHHFQGKHDKLSKKRLQRRRFCFVRHPAYKELIEPEEKTCSSYLDPKRKEFWRTDVDTVLKREMKADKDRYKLLLEHMGNEEGFRKSELLRDREDRWQAFQDYDKNVKWYPGFRNNTSGVKYDIITHRPTDEYEAKRVKAENMKARYNLAKRGLYIQERMSGARPYDILSWRVMPPCRELPEWPEDIGPPPGPRFDDSKIQLNASKGALSFALPFGPFGTFASGIK